MHTTGRIVAVFVAVALLGAAIAVPAAATNGAADADRVGPTVEERAGPPTDLPGSVPAFVERLLGTIRGAVTDLVAAGTVG